MCSINCLTVIKRLDSTDIPQFFVFTTKIISHSSRVSTLYFSKLCNPRGDATFRSITKYKQQIVFIF